MLVLKVLISGHLHGYAMAQLIQRLSDDLLRVEEGSLYPALRRLELNGWIAGGKEKFGNMTQRRESRGVWLLRWWSDLAQDLRYAFRWLRRDAGFATFAILIAGLGVGASTTVFSVVNALLLRPLPFGDPARLVFISNGNEFTSTQTGCPVLPRRERAAP